MAARKKVARRKTERHKAAKRELIDAGTNKLFGRRNNRGTSFLVVKIDFDAAAIDQLIERLLALRAEMLPCKA